MSKEKQILHMLLDGYSQRRIASTCVRIQEYGC